MHRTFAAVASVALACSLGLAVPAPAAAEPYCGITWGSLAKTDAPDDHNAQVSGVRTGRHACFDRMVIELRGEVSGYFVLYASVYTVGKGEWVPLEGDADLLIVVRAPAYDSNGEPTYAPQDREHVADVDGYRTFRQVAYAGSFEGDTEIGLGVRARLPFRVFILDGPGNGSRLVIDVAHRW